MDCERVTRDDAPVEVTEVPWSDPRLAPLFLALWRELDVLYGPNPGTEYRPLDMERPGNQAFLAVAGVPVGCAALVPWHQPDRLEVKRMYVAPSARGSGAAQALLEALAAAARAKGAVALVLETGTRQPAALTAYRRWGFVPIPCWGAFAEDPLSVCFEKRL